MFLLLSRLLFKGALCLFSSKREKPDRNKAAVDYLRERGFDAEAEFLGIENESQIDSDNKLALASEPPSTTTTTTLAPALAEKTFQKAKVSYIRNKNSFRSN